MITQNTEWCITFLMYDNKWYDDVDNKDNPSLQKNNDKYISLNEQSIQLIKWIEKDISYHEKVKIFYIDIKISEHEKKYKLLFYEKKEEGITLNKFRTLELVKNYTGTTRISIENILKQTIGRENAKKNMFIPIGHGAVWGINPYNYKDDLSKFKSKDIPNRLWLQTPITPNQKKYLKKVNDETNSIFEKFRLVYKEIKEDLKIWTAQQTQTILSKFKQNQNEEDNVIRLSKNVELFLLTNKEINDAIKTVLKEKKLDILVLDSCLMQNIFTQYELKDSVEYLVASESGITYPGHNYVSVINEIVVGIVYDSPKSNEEVAKSFCTSITTHPAYEDFKNEIEQTWCFNSIYLNSEILEKLKVDFNDLFDFIMSLIDADLNETSKIYKSVINQAFFYDTYSMSGQIAMIDLRIFFNKLSNTITKNNTLNTVSKTSLLEKLLSIELLLKEIYESIIFFRAEDFYENSQDIQTDERKEYINNISTGITMPIKKSTSLMMESIIENEKKAHTPSFITTNNFGLFLQNLR
jgi:Clostripain family